VSAAALVLALLAAQAQDLGSAPVGIPVERRDVVLPGAELAVREPERDAAIVLRIDAARPHGDAWRYDLVWYGLEPGTYDLAPYLTRTDGSALGELGPLTATVTSLLPPGQIEPHRPAAGELPSLGGYRVLLVLAGVLWTAALLWLVVSGRRRRRAEESAPARPATLAERLRPLVADALAGRLSPAGRSALELGLIALWRRRLGLEQRATLEAVALIRAHPEAGALVRGLEEWLHRPQAQGAQGAGAAEVDVERLLAPYRTLPADALELGPGGGT